jgi:hypothetical protein
MPVILYVDSYLSFSDLIFDFVEKHNETRHFNFQLYDLWPVTLWQTYPVEKRLSMKLCLCFQITSHEEEDALRDLLFVICVLDFTNLMMSLLQSPFRRSV